MQVKVKLQVKHGFSGILIAATLLCLMIGFFTAPCIAQQDQPESTPIATITAGWTYLWADQGAGERSNLNGWFARPSITIGKGYAAFADFTNYYGANKKGSINSHGFTFGVSKMYSHNRNSSPQSLRKLEMYVHQTPQKSSISSPSLPDLALPSQ